MTAKASDVKKAAVNKSITNRKKLLLTLAAIFLLALPLFAAANVQALQPLVAQIQDLFTANQEMLSLEAGIATLEADGEEIVQLALSVCSVKALRGDGTIWVWGRNDWGVLGLGTATNSTQFVPRQMGSDTDWKSIVANTAHVLAIKTDGTLWAWGDNFDGATGFGITEGEQTTPRQVGTDTDWKIAEVGFTNSMAIKEDGTLWSWGRNRHGQIGIGIQFINPANQTTPIQVGTDTDWQSISVGTVNSLAIKTDGTLWGWGGNGRGQSGLGEDVSMALVPTQVGTDTDWYMVSAENDYTLAIKQDGSLWAWGWNQSGKTGLGTTSGIQFEPMRVGTDNDWKTVVASWQHAIAQKTDGTIWTWGGNTWGETGHGVGGAAAGSQTTPLQVGTDADWHIIAANQGNTLATKQDGTIWAWGSNSSGIHGKGILMGGQGNGNVITDGTNNWLPWRMAASPVPTGNAQWASPNNATTPPNGSTGRTNENTDSITIFFDRPMRTDAAFLGTITVDNGAIVDVAAGTWRESIWLDPGAARGMNVFTAPVTLLASNTLHTATVSGFVDTFCPARSPSHLHTWTFTTGEIPTFITSVEPYGEEVAANSRAFTLRFSEEMNPSLGTVNISIDESTPDTGGISTAVPSLDRANATWNTEVTEISIPMSGIRPNTTYSVEVAGFTSAFGYTVPTQIVGFGTSSQEFEEADITDIAITKHLQMPVGTITPDTEFTFDITAYSFNYDTDQADVLPTIAVPNLTFSPSDEATVAGDVRTVTQVSDLLIGDTIVFPSPGLFAYRISERNDTFSNSTTETMTFDPTVYQVTFIVLPDSETGENLVSSIIVQEVLPGGTLGSKIEDLSTALTFTNTFVRNVDIDPTDPLATGGLRISKTTTGIMPDFSRAFDFDIRLSAPSLATTETPPIIYRAQIIDTLTNEAIGSVIEFTDEVTRTVALTHNQTLVFLDTHVGARYTAVELPVSDYTPHVVVRADGVIDTSVINPPERTPNVSLSTGEQTLGEAANTADFTNTDFFVPPTGLDIGKFGLALLLMAIVALIVIVTATRRSKREMELAVLTQ